MKELFLRNRISKDSKKREYCIEEITSENGFVKKTQKNCAYFIKKEHRFASWRDLLIWLSAQKIKDPKSLREISVIRSINPDTGEGKALLKVTGTVYAKLKGEIYEIKYVHSLAFGLERKSQANLLNNNTRGV